MQHNHKSGVSLTELSIALVVIALLIGAVIQGASLQKAAKLKTVGAEIKEKQTWINGFRAVYNQLPGDFSYAADYWADASTVSGDEDGEIEFYNGSNFEGYRAWEHLSYAQIAQTQFSGGPSPTTNAAELNIDVPESVVNGGGYFLDYSNFSLTDNNILALGVPHAPDSNSLVLDGVLTAQEAFTLDAKLDDNQPDTGSLRAEDGDSSSGTDCVTAGGAYNVANEGRHCVMAYRLSTE